MTTAPDMLKQFGGAPVASADRFEGWWSENVYFVDFDNGTAGATGKDDMNRPAKDMQRAIDDVTKNATIYVRPRAFSTGTYPEDPQQITPSADDAENFHIDAGKKNVSLIGTGKGLSHAAAHKCWIGGYSGLTTAVLSVYSPGCVIENFRAQPPSSGAGGIFYTINDSTYDGGNATFVNNDFHDGNTTAALRCYGTWQMAIVGNRFLNCDVGIYTNSTYSVPQIWEVYNNRFNAVTTEVRADFHADGGIKRFLAYNNYHACGQPAAGSPNKYYMFSTTSTGAVFNCFFGTNDATEATAMTLNGVLQAGNYTMNGLLT